MRSITVLHCIIDSSTASVILSLGKCICTLVVDCSVIVVDVSYCDGIVIVSSSKAYLYC